jgi:SAM-dependent methyltransferase
MSRVFDAYAAYYDLLYKDKDYVGEAQFIRDLLSKHGVGSGNILELGCGTGKHAEHLVRLGYGVHGVDMSPAMVDSANARKPAEFCDRLTFEVGDARTVKVAGEFNAVVSLFHVASYQTRNDDISAMFWTAASHLKVGGLFIFDCWYGPAVLTDRPTVRVKRIEGDTFDVLRIAEPAMHPNENVVDVNYTVQVTRKPDGQVSQFQETHRMRYLFAPEILLYLELSGMRQVSMVEWLTGAEAGFETWGVTFVAEKGDK